MPIDARAQRYPCFRAGGRATADCLVQGLTTAFQNLALGVGGLASGVGGLALGVGGLAAAGGPAAVGEGR